MATNTDWSKFQRKELYTLLKIQQEIKEGTSYVLDNAIEGLIAVMENEDIILVKEALNGNRL